MNWWRSSISMLVLCSVLLQACGTSGTTPKLAIPTAPQDHYVLDSGSLRSDSGCLFDYLHYKPTQPSSTSQLLLGHGFLRSQNTLIELSKAFANRGIAVATLNFCNMRPWNGHHERNAQDMRKLARHLNIQQQDVVYGGFSAGALAAILASDSSQRAVLALDLVDQNQLALNAAKALDIPVVSLHGPPSRCNNANRALGVFEQIRQHAGSDRVSVTLIPDASHCEFESPSSWLCERLCGDDDSAKADRRTRSAIIEKATGLLMPYFSATPR